MSTVKLITPYNKELEQALKGHPVRILRADKGMTIEGVIRAIFKPYEGKLVIFGEFAEGDLPVDSHAYLSATEVAHWGLDNTIYGILNDYSTRTTSEDNVTYYDVYQIWREARHLEAVKKSVRKLALAVYGDTSVEDLAPWGGKTIRELRADNDDDYKRIMGADLSFPIIMRWGGRGILDGHHRLIKCILTGRTYISVIVMPGARLRKCKISRPMEDYWKQF